MANNAVGLFNGRTLTATINPGDRNTVSLPDKIHQTYMIFFQPSPPYPVHMRERESGDDFNASALDGTFPPGNGLLWGRRREVDSLAFYNPGSIKIVAYVVPVTVFL